jgi:hypothetical protein
MDTGGQAETNASVETAISPGLKAAFDGPTEIESAFTDIVMSERRGESDSFGADDAASLAVGFTPAGVAADVYTAIFGEDFFTGEEVSGIWRFAGLIPFVSEARKGYKIADAVHSGDNIVLGLDGTLKHGSKITGAANYKQWFDQGFNSNGSMDFIDSFRQATDKADHIFFNLNNCS